MLGVILGVGLGVGETPGGVHPALPLYMAYT